MNWKTEKRKLIELIPVEYNPRSLSNKEYKDLKKSLEKFSLAEIPVINKDNTILAGHMRTKILADLYGKDYEIDVRVPDTQLTKEESDEYLIRSNKNTGEWDFDILANDFNSEDLIDWGFDKEELFGNIEELEPEGINDMSDNVETHLRVEVIVNNEIEQEKIFTEMTERGYKCKLLTL